MTFWSSALNKISLGLIGGGCHETGSPANSSGLRKIGIVGNPNVGKSVIFNNLTGSRVTVSNYPGTTVDVSRGKIRLEGEEFEVVDTPGMYSFLPITEEERVARLLLLKEKPDVILHVVDARNLDRMLPLTIQMMEAGLPVILDLNMMDETEGAGIEIDVKELGDKLSIPVTATIATSGHGMEALRKTLNDYVGNQSGTGSL